MGDRREAFAPAARKTGVPAPSARQEDLGDLHYLGDLRAKMRKPIQTPCRAIDSAKQA
jgi:hypothetical protein